MATSVGNFEFEGVIVSLLFKSISKMQLSIIMEKN